MLIVDARDKVKPTLLDDTKPGDVFIWNNRKWLRLKSLSDCTTGPNTRLKQSAQVVDLDQNFKTTLPRNTAVELVNAVLTIETVK